MIKLFENSEQLSINISFFENLLEAAGNDFKRQRNQINFPSQVSILSDLPTEESISLCLNILGDCFSNKQKVTQNF